MIIVNLPMKKSGLKLFNYKDHRDDQTWGLKSRLSDPQQVVTQFRYTNKNDEWGGFSSQSSG